MRTWARRLLVALGVVLGLAVLALLWGVVVEPRFVLDVCREDARIPGLPEAWNGRRIAAFGDVQVGMTFDNTGMVKKIVARTIQERPDAVLLLGDFIYPSSGMPVQDEVLEVEELLRPLVEAGIPVYAVLGNHDYDMPHPDTPPSPGPAQKTTAMLASLGVHLLSNGVVNLSSRGPSLYLVGIGPAWPRLDDPRGAVNRVPAGAPRVVFMHNPESYRRLPAGAAPFAVAGHTHGGQVRIPLLPRWSWLHLVRPHEIAVDGWIDKPDYGAPGNHLYVNRGVGFSTFPIRLNCPPELTIFTLRPAGEPARARRP